MESEACVAGVKGEAKKKREEEEGASSFFLVPRPSIPTLFPPPPVSRLCAGYETS